MGWLGYVAMLGLVLFCLYAIWDLRNVSPEDAPPPTYVEEPSTIWNKNGE